MTKNNKVFIKIWFILLASFLFIELGFKLLAFNNLFKLETWHILLFTLSSSAFFAYIISFFKTTVIRILTPVCLCIYSIYAIIQLAFYSYSGFLSFSMATGGDLNRFGDDMVKSFFSNALKPQQFILLLPFILVLVLAIFKKEWWTRSPLKLWNKLGQGFLVLLLEIGAVASLWIPFLNDNNQIKPNKSLYFNPSIVELAIKEFGVGRFLYIDITSLFSSGESNDVVTINKPSKPEVPTDYSRIIDDTEWQKLINNETNPVIKNMHEYFINRSVTPKNDATGLFKGKNLIYIMVEALDYAAIDQVVAPTIYKMMNEGWFFDHYYSPKYSCTTGESEFIGETSLVPSLVYCTNYQYVNNTYPVTVFNLFNNASYTATSYHNWKDQFYPRKQFHKTLGSSRYYNYDDFTFTKGGGWPSDLELLEQAYPIMKQSDPFMGFIITSSMHFPYSYDTRITKKNWDKVKSLDVSTTMKRYLAKVVELDLALEYLLKTLEADGILEDTVIVMYGDHHPLTTMPLKELYERSPFDRTIDLDEDRLPFFIYNAGSEPKMISKTVSSFDILPTIANLFDLDYDPRYYAGVDIFSKETPMVLFPNGSILTDDFVYFAKEGKIKLKTNITEEEAQKQVKTAGDMFTIYNNVLVKDYFKYRFPK